MYARDSIRREARIYVHSWYDNTWDRVLKRTINLEIDLTWKESFHLQFLFEILNSIHSCKIFSNAGSTIKRGAVLKSYTTLLFTSKLPFQMGLKRPPF